MIVTKGRRVTIEHRDGRHYDDGKFRIIASAYFDGVVVTATGFTQPEAERKLIDSLKRYASEFYDEVRRLECGGRQ